VGVLVTVHRLKLYVAHGGTLPNTPITTLYTIPSTIASYTSWVTISNDADVPTDLPRTTDVDIHCLGFAVTQSLLLLWTALYQPWQFAYTRDIVILEFGSGLRFELESDSPFFNAKAQTPHSDVLHGDRHH
jgi:hypothetical protein